MNENETGLVFNTKGETIYWHTPAGRTGGSLPDSKELWDVLWGNRKILGGVAHTHPWVGAANPSHTDTTTWRALEKGLGKLLLWPIVTFTETKWFGWNHWAEQYEDVTAYVKISIDVEALRKLSRYGEAAGLLAQALQEGTTSDLEGVSALLGTFKIPQSPLGDGTVCPECHQDTLVMREHLAMVPGGILCTACGFKEGYYAHLGRNMVKVTPLE